LQFKYFLSAVAAAVSCSDGAVCGASHTPHAENSSKPERCLRGDEGREGGREGWREREGEKKKGETEIIIRKTTVNRKIINAASIKRKNQKAKFGN
jgi:hypothetical protein